MAEQPLDTLAKIKQEATNLMEERDLAAQAEPRAPGWRRFAHFWFLVGRSFDRNRCPMRASALAYGTLLALIPMLAVILSVSTSILKAQGEEPIRRFVNALVEQVTPYIAPKTEEADANAAARTERLHAEAQAAREQMVQKINEFIDRTRTGTITATGAVLLLFVAISMLSRIEAAFNDIWGVARGRSWYMRVVLYWAAITLGPVILIAALGLASTGALQVRDAGSHFYFLTAMPWLHSLLSSVLPPVILSLLFAMIYLLLPNTRVHFSAAMVGGLTAGLLWHANNQLGVLFVSRISSSNAVYGSLGLLPVFMVGLYLGWLILLFGAQVAYAWQNRQAYLQDRLADAVHQRSREFIAVRLMGQIAQHFHRREPPPTLSQLATSLGVPSRLLIQLFQPLLQAQLVVEVRDRESAYAPARPLDQINVQEILVALRTGTGHELATREGPARELARSELARVQDAERAAAAPLTLQRWVQELEG